MKLSVFSIHRVRAFRPSTAPYAGRLLFATGARNVPLSTLGLLQYITPTIQFIIGVFLYHESFTPDRMIGFSIIWLALILFSAESFLTARRGATLATAD